MSFTPMMNPTNDACLGCNVGHLVHDKKRRATWQCDNDDCSVRLKVVDFLDICELCGAYITEGLAHFSRMIGNDFKNLHQLPTQCLLLTDDNANAVFGKRVPADGAVCFKCKGQLAPASPALRTKTKDRHFFHKKCAGEEHEVLAKKYITAKRPLPEAEDGKEEEEEKIKMTDVV